MSMKVTQKEIKSQLCIPGSVDCTHMDQKDYEKIMKEELWLEEIAYSCGLYGCNGVFYIGHKTGKRYIIAGRSTALFIFH